MTDNRKTSPHSRLRVGVIMGGRSIEREVSFNSGRTICDHLDSALYEMIPLFQRHDGALFILPWQFLHRGKIADFVDRLEDEATRLSWDDVKKHIDFMYIAVHGRYAEDGILQGTLEVLKIPYTGAKLFGSAVGMNKVIQKQILKSHGVRVPRGINLYPARMNKLEKKEHQKVLAQELEERELAFPLIVKPSEEGSSLGMRVAYSFLELLDALQFASTCFEKKNQPVVVEEKLVGREFTFVGLQRGKDEWQALPLTEIKIEEGSDFYDYEQKYMPGRATKITPAHFSDEQRTKIEAACKLTLKAMQFCTITRIDGFLLEDDSVIIIDPNSLSGMAPASFVFHQAAVAGMNHTHLINFLIASELDQTEQGILMPVHQEKRDDQKCRVGVLLAGDSNEREISLESGRNVCYKLSPHKYKVTPLFVSEKMELFKLTPELLLKNGTHEIEPHLTDELKISWSQLPEQFDFIFNALHGGKGEDGSIQGMLEMLDMPYNGSGVLASSICMDKFKTNQFLASHGFAVPRGLLVDTTRFESHTNEEQQKLLEELVQKKELTFPLIAKPHNDGCSVMVQRCADLKELHGAVNNIVAEGKSGALIEEVLGGVELTVGIYGNDTTTVLPASRAISSDGTILSIEDKFLPGHGENQTPAPLSEYEQALVQHTLSEVYKTLECKGYARIDCFYQKTEESPTNEDRVVILEINSLPGLTPATCLFHQAAEAGMQPMEFIDKIIELGFELHGRATREVQPSEKSPQALQ